MCVMLVCKCRHRDATALTWQLEDHFRESVVSFNPWEWAQVTWLQGKCFYLLSHLADLNNFHGSQLSAFSHFLLKIPRLILCVEH